MNADGQYSVADDHPRHILRRGPWPWAMENPRPQKKVKTKGSGYHRKLGQTLTGSKLTREPGNKF